MTVGTASERAPGVSRDAFPVVALVGSAGGLDAVIRVLAPLPATFPGSVIVLLHSPPDRANELVRIISRSCQLPVVEAEADLPLRPAQVVVVPPGTHLLITADRGVLATALITSGPVPPSRPSADLLLTTLATAAGCRAIAVILSGRGHDGATGAAAVHVRGGAVVASDEATSSEFSMPLAAIQRDGAVSDVLPLDAIGAHLLRLVTG